MLGERGQRFATLLANAGQERPGAVSGEEFLAFLRDPPDDVFDPDGEFVMVGDEFGAFSAEATGREAAEVWGDWIETYDDYRLEPVDLEEGDDVLLFLGRARGRTRTGGVEVEHEAGAVFRYRGDCIWRAELYLDWDQARAAAGLKGDA